MLKRSFLLIITAFCCSVVYCQHIQYSRTLVKFPNAEAMQLVADVDGYHHLLSFNRGEKPIVDIFDQQLKHISRQETDIAANEKSRVSIVKFKTHYLLYFHVPGSAGHTFLKVQGNGAITDISADINDKQNSLWHKSSASFQLVNQDEKLSLVTNTYFDSLKIVTTTIIRFDKNYKAVHRSSIAVSYDPDKEKLRQLTLHKNQLYVLKEKRSVHEEIILELVKMDLDSKKMITKEFSSQGTKFINPGFQFNEGDSSIVLTSLLPEAGRKGETAYVIFLSRLDYSLQELTSASLLRSELGDDLSTNMLLVYDRSAEWTPFSNVYLRTKSPQSTTEQINNYWAYEMGAYPVNYPYPYSAPLSRLSVGTSTPHPPSRKIKLTLLNKQLEIVKYRKIKPHQGVPPEPGRDMVSFNANETPCVVIAQNYLRKKNGLALLYPTAKNEIALADIRAYDDYNYYLSLLRVVNSNFVILPFSNKKELGLLKINIKSYQDEN